MYRKELGLPIGALAALALLLGACSTGDRVTGVQQQPGTGTPCAGGNAVTLGTLQGVRLDCSSGTTVTLPNASGNFLIVPNLAVGDVPIRSVSYVIGAQGGGAAASVAPAASVSALLGAPEALLRAWASAPPAGPGRPQRAFDAALRARARRNLSAGTWSAAALRGLRASVSAAVPPVGSLRQFHVVSTLDTVRVKYARVTAQLQYVGTSILIYVDTASPAGGFSSAQLANFGQTFDQVLYPIDLSTFGSPSDIDQNGHLIMLLSPVVNGLTSRSDCATQGYIAGFFDGVDLVSRDTVSNQGEVFYALAPDPNGAVSCAHPATVLEDELGATFLHEVQHLINFSEHVVVRNGDQEEGWLDEGESLVAEELGARYYEAKYPPPTGRSNPLQLFPDSAEGYISGDLVTSYSYLLRTDTSTLTLHTDADGGLNWRGGDWLLLRYLGDRKGNQFFAALDQSAITGIANIQAAAGASFDELFGDFSVALYTDSVPGVARSQIPSQYRFSSRNLRQLFAAYYRVAGGSSDVPFPFPVQPRSLPATGTLAGTILPGTMGFFSVAGTGGSLTITFATPSGTALPANLHAQLSIFRLP